MVPKGWSKNNLDSLFSFKNGVNASKQQYGTGYKFVNLMDIFQNPILKAEYIIGSVTITQNQFENYQLKYGDVLFNRTSETDDEIAYSSVYLDTAPAVFGGFVIKGSPITQKIDPKYSVYAFYSNYFRSQVIRLGQGAVRANIGQKDLNKTYLLLPPIKEQQKIARILSAWDKAIEVTKKLISNSQTQKKALMQQLLTGKKRLLDENGERFSRKWEKVKISQFLSESKQPSINNDPSKRLTVRLHLNGIEAREFRGSEAENSTLHFIRKAGQFIYGRQNFHKGAFGIIPKELDLYESSQDIPCFDFTNKCSPLWFFYMCSRKNFYEFIENLMTGTGSKRLHPSSFLEISFATPSLKEQTKIATVLSNADREIELLEKKLEYLKQEKKALMQQLLTGKRRVEVDE